MAMNNEKKATAKFTMKPGSKQVDSPSTFRMDSPLKQLGMNPTQASPVMEKKSGYDKSKEHTGAGKKSVNKDTRAGYITKDGQKTNDASKSKYKERRAQSLRAQSIKKYGRRSPHYKTHNADGSKK